MNTIKIPENHPHHQPLTDAFAFEMLSRNPIEVDYEVIDRKLYIPIELI